MIRDIPLSEWLKDVKEAFEIVDTSFKEGTLTITLPNEYYKLAPKMVAERRLVIDETERESMEALTRRNAKFEFSCDNQAYHNYQFQFVLAYVHAHEPAGIFCERTADRLMDYINAHWNIFEKTTWKKDQNK